MGLFSRKEAASGSRRRSSPPSEAHAEDLRGRARQRLIGALALVVAAVVVVPMLIKSEPEQPAQTPVVVPAIPPVPEPSIAAGEPPLPDSDAAQGELSVDTPALPVPEPIEPAAPGQAASEQAAADTKPEPQSSAEAEPEPKPKPESKPESKPKSAASERTDDGSVAIALLEGREPSPAASSKGNFVVQIAAYTSQKDAQARRDSLVSAGVTNAYVESASPDGKTTYRLRVGPFPTREAAQAAQTRLRSLDYVNSFISTQ